MLYESQRVSTGEIVPRGDKAHSSGRLVNFLHNAHLDWNGAKVQFGLMLTGEKLVDDLDYRESLKKLESEAIGGEMEGAGLYVSCQDAKVDWILVKAICDWADGNKDHEKKQRQQQAAENAAAFVLHALQHATLQRLTPAHSKNRNESQHNDDQKVGVLVLATETLASTSLVEDSVVQLDQEFNIAKKDRDGESRRKEIAEIQERLVKLQVNTFFAKEFKIRIWLQLMIEARCLKDYLYAIKNILMSFEDLLKSNITPLENEHAVELLAEWAIDFSQSASKDVELNKIAFQLNKAITSLGQLIGVNVEGLVLPMRLSTLLCMRSKCKRALGRLYRRRHQYAQQANILRRKALEDAQRAFDVYQSPASGFELALCLFANATSDQNELAIKALGLLEESSKEAPLPYGYELVKQYKIRHRFEAAIRQFLRLSEVEKDQRRFHVNLTYFATSVIGLYYQYGITELVTNTAMQACQWLEECIDVEHHNATNIVDLCYVRAICGIPVNETIKYIDRLKPTSDTTWDDTVSMVKDIAQEKKSLGAGLLLGLEDAMIWGRIGTFFADFCHEYTVAIQWYERASMIDSRSPIYHFNKAKLLAIHQHNYEAAATSLMHAKILESNSHGWFVANRKEIERLERKIHEGSNQ